MPEDELIRDLDSDGDTDSWELNRPPEASEIADLGANAITADNVDAAEVTSRSDHGDSSGQA